MPGNGGIDRVLIGPRGVTAGGVDEAVDGICPDELPRIHRRTVVIRIARQPRGVDGFYSTISRSIGAPAVEGCLVDFDTLFVLGCRAVCDSRCAGASKNTIPRIIL